MNEFGNFIKNLRTEKKLTQGQIEKYSGISHAYLSQLENGKRPVPKPKTLDKLAKGLHVDSAVLYKAANIIPDSVLESFDSNVDVTHPLSFKDDEVPQLPIYGRIFAGAPSGVEEDIEGSITPEKSFVDKYGLDELMSLRVVGDSMTKAGISENAVAVIHKTSDFDNGDIVVAIINGDAGTLKRAYKRTDGIYFEPDSYNPIYKPFSYTQKQIEDEDPTVIIVGVYLYSVSGII